MKEAVTPSQRMDGEKAKYSLVVAAYIDRVIKKYGNSGKNVTLAQKARIDKSINGMSAEAKAHKIWEYVHAISFEGKRGKNEQNGDGSAMQTVVKPYAMAELNKLWEDDAAKKLFLDRYEEFKADMHHNRPSGLEEDRQRPEITPLLKNELWLTERMIAQARRELIKIEKDLNLKKISGHSAIVAARSELRQIKEDLAELYSTRNKILHLTDREKTSDNTDVLALEMDRILSLYRKQAQEGFVWTPSRVELLERINTLSETTGKAVLLIGPPGTGKTSLVDAYALEKTGEKSVEVVCTPSKSDDLIQIEDFKKGEGAYKYTGTLTQAATGYTHSLDEEPEVTVGRVARVDEIHKLNEDKSQGPLKQALVARVGRAFCNSGHPTLPGYEIVATANEPIAAEALDREFVRLPVDYLEMKPENVESFEFMASLLKRDDGSFAPIKRSAIFPKYERIEIAQDKRKKLKDGRTIVAENVLVEDPADSRHGYLYRMAYAIRTIQDAYILGSKFNEKHLANTALYVDVKMNVKGYDCNVSAKNSSFGGEALKLTTGSSTLTTKTIGLWIDSFTRSGKPDLVEWLKLRMKEHIASADEIDRPGLQVIANYFHLFDPQPDDKMVFLTPKEIGYLSPRVPRPVEAVQTIEVIKNPEDRAALGAREVTTTQIALESGATVNINVGPVTIGTESAQQTIVVGKNFRNDKGKDFSFEGLVEYEGNEHDGKLVGQLIDEQGLYNVFTAEQVDRGIFVYDTDKLLEDINGNMKKLMQVRWETACVNNAENNPDDITAPTW